MIYIVRIGRHVYIGPGSVGKYSCACVAANGCIYAPPYNARQTLRISEKGEVSPGDPKHLSNPSKAFKMPLRSTKTL